MLSFALLAWCCQLQLASGKKHRHTQEVRPTRFLILSYQHSGTHFVRDTLTKQQGVYVWDEVCRRKDFTDAFNRSCLDLMSFLLGLHAYNYTPAANVVEHIVSFVARPMNISKPINSKRYCASSEPISSCYGHYLNQVQSMGMLIQQGQGWVHRAFVAELIRRLNKNRVDHHVAVRVLVLHRTNYIAHSMSASNTMTQYRPTFNTTKHVIDLEKMRRDYTAIRSRFYETVNDLIASKVETVFVTYEHICTHPGNVTAVMKHLNIPVTSSLNVTTNTKFHTNATYTYIENIGDVASALYQQGAFGHALGGKSSSLIEMCMLFDNCVVAPPRFCASIPCFV